MTLQDLIALYRSESLDTATPPLCDDPLLILYANEAQDEACRRALLLRDEVSPACTLAYTAGEPIVRLKDAVVQVDRAFVDGWPVDVLTAEQMDAFMPAWRARSQAPRPRALVVGVGTRFARLWPAPSEDGALQLVVYRLGKPMAAPSDQPEIRPEAHRALVEWMLYRAYSRMDTDLYNDAKAAVRLANFEAEFGGKASARNEQWQRAGHHVAPDPIA